MIRVNKSKRKLDSLLIRVLAESVSACANRTGRGVSHRTGYGKGYWILGEVTSEVEGVYGELVEPLIVPRIRF